MVALRQTMFFALFLMLWNMLWNVPSASADGTLVTDLGFNSVGLGRNVPLRIYEPEGYSENGAPYRLYIFLHGCCGDNQNGHSFLMSQALNNKINSGEIEPMVVAFPLLQGAEFGNRHEYTDSPREGNGPYSSVISEELLAYLSENYNVRTDRLGRAIGGFSMGGDGALRMAIRNSEKFIAAISHSGAPALEATIAFLPDLIAECPESEPPYTFDPGNGPVTYNVWGLGSAFSPYPPAQPRQSTSSDPIAEGFRGDRPPYDIYFPVLPSGEPDESVFTDLWLAHHDVIHLLRDPLVYTNPIYMHFEAGTGGDDALPFNELLHEQMGEEFPHSYTTHSGGHMIPLERFEWTLVWLDERMDDAAADAPQTSSVCASGLKGNFPNPARAETVISYTVGNEPHVELDLLDAQGRRLRFLARGEEGVGSHELRLDTRELPSGVYFYRLRDNAGIQSRKLIVTR